MKITEESAQKYLKMATGCPACGEKGTPVTKDADGRLKLEASA